MTIQLSTPPLHLELHSINGENTIVFRFRCAQYVGFTFLAQDAHNLSQLAISMPGTGLSNVRTAFTSIADTFRSSIASNLGSGQVVIIAVGVTPARSYVSVSARPLCFLDGPFGLRCIVSAFCFIHVHVFFFCFLVAFFSIFISFVWFVSRITYVVASSQRTCTHLAGGPTSIRRHRIVRAISVDTPELSTIKQEWVASLVLPAPTLHLRGTVRYTSIFLVKPLVWDNGVNGRHFTLGFVRHSRRFSLHNSKVVRVPVPVLGTQ